MDEAIVFAVSAPDVAFLPEARVIGADPSYAFSGRGSAKRVLSSPISAGTCAPSWGPRPLRACFWTSHLFLSCRF
ncbi:hypothetical protein QR77_38215 [Streptomyces sp. 150FB]|nr:hypothetical protein QR77_38215 [Streptomyces sp. 150FB]